MREAVDLICEVAYIRFAVNSDEMNSYLVRLQRCFGDSKLVLGILAEASFQSIQLRRGSHNEE